MSESTIAQAKLTFGSLASVASSNPGVVAALMAVHGAAGLSSEQPSFAAVGSLGTVSTAKVRLLRDPRSLSDDEIQAGAALCEAFGVRPEDLGDDDFEELSALWR